MVDDLSLPAEFLDLAPFVERWALTTNSERYAARTSASMEELRHFYDKFLPRLEQAIDFLNVKPMDEFDEGERSLLRLCLAMSEVGLAVEVYKAPALMLAPSADRFRVWSAGLLVE